MRAETSAAVLGPSATPRPKAVSPTAEAVPQEAEEPLTHESCMETGRLDLFDLETLALRLGEHTGELEARHGALALQLEEALGAASEGGPSLDDPDHPGYSDALAAHAVRQKGLLQQHEA